MQPDGKYGSGTATAARKQLGSFAPSACHPRPSWWLPPGQSNLGGAAPASMPAPMQAAGAWTHSAPIPGPGGPGGGGGPGGPGGSTSVVVQPGGGGTYPLPAPKKPGISTGAIIAGAIGVAGLVGIVALAVSGGKKTTTRYRTRKGQEQVHHAEAAEEAPQEEAPQEGQEAEVAMSRKDPRRMLPCNFKRCCPRVEVFDDGSAVLTDDDADAGSVGTIKLRPEQVARLADVRKEK